MRHTSQSGSVLEFGPFCFHPASRMLRKRGTAIRLNGMPLKVLVHLLERPGELVSRTELQHLLWNDAAYGNFEQGLNSVVNLLRGVLSDRADQPNYIETVPGEGYRFIAPVRFVIAESPSLESLPESPPITTSGGRETEASPLPSQNSNFSRFRCAFENTNTCPLRGSPNNRSRTRPYSPSKPLRMSVAPAAK
jgi:DNA-binding winged helix-turn-helix (wHTH) protein